MTEDQNKKEIKMEKVLELLKSLSFLKAVCYIIEVLILTFAPQYALVAGSLLLAVVAVLNLFGIQPELRARAALMAEEAKKSKLVKAKK
jgi:hypothetical protein